jgi:Fe-S-cluster containining protein
MMNETSRFSTLITQYKTLGQYCDNAFAATFHAYRAHMHCVKGCASCCLLETVVPLEAYVIDLYLQSLGSSVATFSTKHPEYRGEKCVFLDSNACTIYPVRPIICRTHGMPILYPDQEGIDVCPLNFSQYDFASLDPKHLLDAGVITENLMRLNLAFCIMTGQTETANERIPLHSIRPGEYRNVGVVSRFSH